MKPDRTTSKTRKLVTAFAGDQSGAVAAYVAILIAVLVGFVGLAVDFGRLYTTHSQAQSAADAAALAAATQLNGESDAIERATIAAMTSPLVNNNQDFAEGDATVQIVQLRFLHSLPLSDDDPITDAFVTTNPASAGYVEATTETLTQFNAFLAALGAGSSDTLARAVAGNNTLYCKIPPLMICNPWEPPLPDGWVPGVPEDPPYEPDVDALNEKLKGVTLLSKTYEGGTSNWAAGNAGLLDPPPTCVDSDEEGRCTEWDWTTNNGAKAVTLSMARVPVDYCYPDTPLSVRTGQAASMRSAVNTWFDIYEMPHMGKDKFRTDPDFRPAQNVTKGYITDWVQKVTVDPDTGLTTTTEVCESTPVNDPTVAMGLPPDDCFAGGVDFADPTIPCATSNALDVGAEDRIGDGIWSEGLAQYMATMHPGTPPTDGFVLPAPLPGDSLPSRYAVYQAEIAQNAIPNLDTSVAPDPVNGENGNPICYGPGGYTTPEADPDRRVLPIAVINCLREDVKGNSTPNVKAAFFADMFVLRPIRGGGTDKGNIWLELIDLRAAGTHDAHDIVQLYR